MKNIEGGELFMTILRSRRAQSTAEYAVLFAIVIGAAIAMQQYVKSRLQGGIAGTANNYMNASIALGGFGTFEPNRTVGSANTIDLAMTSARAGTVDINSQSTTTVTKQ
jgi:uncharacterized membrane protein YadS